MSCRQGLHRLALPSPLSLFLLFGLSLLPAIPPTFTGKRRVEMVGSHLFVSIEDDRTCLFQKMPRVPPAPAPPPPPPRLYGQVMRAI